MPSLYMLIEANQDHVFIFNTNKIFNIKIKQSRPIPLILVLVNKSRPLEQINKFIDWDTGLQMKLCYVNIS